MDNELKTLDQFIEDSEAHFHARRRLRESNLPDNIEYPNELTLNKLDSSIKKNSAFVKKLRVFTESQKEQLQNDLDRLNSTKFISEVATSIIEAKLKLGDIPAIVEVCSRLNQTYREFSKQLLEQYVKYFPVVRKKNNDLSTLTVSSSNQIALVGPNVQAGNLVIKNQNSKNQQQDQHSWNLSKIRVDLRLFAELIIAGIFPLKDSLPVLMNLLCYLMVYDKNSYQNASAILTFCKGCGDELLGLAPKSIQELSVKYGRNLPSSDLISKKRQELLKTYVRDYHQSLLKHLNGLHDELSEAINKSKRAYKSSGEHNKDSCELVDIKHSECLKVQNILQQLADLLGEESVELPDLVSLKENTRDRDGEVDASLDTGSSSLWDDEGICSFYEELIDLKSLFPHLVERVSSGIKKGDSILAEKNLNDSDQIIPPNDCDAKLSVAGGSRDSTPTKVTEDASEQLEKTISLSSSEESLVAEGENSIVNNMPSTMNHSLSNRLQPDQYFTKLSNCVNRDMIDNAAIDFMKFFNTKFGRRRLVKTLFNVKRTRLDLLPFFARLTATLHRYVPSIGNELFLLLKQDFRNLFRKKDQINIESKVKNVRFIGELVKFNLYSKEEALNCLRMLLSDFTHHHIEMTCNLLETCGRFLYKSQESHQQLRLLLEQMMRKKLLLSIDSKYVTMIENAYYFTNPPEVVRHIIEEPPVHVYVRYLLCECLNRSTIEKILQKIKKLNWSDQTLTKFVINCMIEAYNLKFYNIRYLAALLAALNREHQWISIAVIDGVVEDILLMMEINELHFNQRRIPMIRYFGELYNYRLSDSSLVFKILYSLITYGVYYPEPEQTLSQIPMSQLDSPDNLFRIKLVCDLLDTCGQYLTSGQEKRKLDCYLLFFQRYYWCKKHIYLLHPYCLAKSGNHFPASIEYLYNDAIYNLRPKFKMASSYSQAIQSVKDFVNGLKDGQRIST